MSAAIITEAILIKLKERAAGLIWATELAMSSGARRCDFWTLHPHRSKGYHATAYEIKASRADYKKETWQKQRDARLFSDEFYYVAPKGMIKIEELPDWAGLWEYDADKDILTCALEAPRRDKDAPSWELVVSIMRNSGDIRRDTDLLKTQLRHAEQQVKMYRERDKQRWREQMNAPSPHRG